MTEQFFHEFTLIFLWISYELSARYLWNHNLLRHFTMNSLSLPRNHCEFTIALAISLWIHCRDFAGNSSFFRESAICFAISSRIQFLPRNHYRFTIVFAISIWIHCLNPEITMNTLFFREINLHLLSAWRFLFKVTLIFGNSLSFSRITFFFANVPWITLNYLELPLNYLFFREITMNSLSSSRYHFDSTICFVISLWIHYHFHEINVNSLPISRFYYEFNIFSPKSLLIHFFIAETIWIHYFCRDFTMISLSAWWFHYEYRKIKMISLSSSRNHYEYTINIAILRWIHYIFRVFTIIL